VDKLRVPLTALTPDGVPVDSVVSVADLSPQDAEPFPAESVRVRGTLLEMSSEYLFRGTISGVFKRACDRCLEEAEVAFSVEALWVFKEGLGTKTSDSEAEDVEDDGDMTVCGFEGNEIDLAPCVWEELVLATPSKLLCREDCAGLCPQCGVNLNRGPCARHERGGIKNKGLAELAELLPELRARSSEEKSCASTKETNGKNKT